MLVGEQATEAYTCCDENQIDTLEAQLVASELLFERCPSCIENFLSFYCHVSFLLLHVGCLFSSKESKAFISCCFCQLFMIDSNTLYQ